MTQITVTVDSLSSYEAEPQATANRLGQFYDVTVVADAVSALIIGDRDKVSLMLTSEWEMSSAELEQTLSSAL